MLPEYGCGGKTCQVTIILRYILKNKDTKLTFPKDLDFVSAKQLPQLGVCRNDVLVLRSRLTEADVIQSKGHLQ